MSFSINCLEITATKADWQKAPSLYKNLLSEKDYLEFEKSNRDQEQFHKRFFFNDFYYHSQYGDLIVKSQEQRALPDDFFGKNINIQAVVGKNGSGKSTLMDLMYIAINNFCYMFERGNKRKRPGAAELYFVPALYLILYFSSSDTLYELAINNNSVILRKQASNKETIFEAILDEIGQEDSPTIRNAVHTRYSDSQIKDLVEKFFYTIVSNYSMQSFVDSNYEKNTFHYIDDFDVQKKHYKKIFENHDYNKEFDSKTNFRRSWISPIFHKNDGYIRSIVLNPFRSNGELDLSNEYELSKDRFCSLMIYSQINKNVTFFKPYSFSSIEAFVNYPRLSKWCYDIYMESTSPEEFRYIDSTTVFSRIVDWIKIYNKEHLFTKKIIEIFNLGQYLSNQDLFWYSIIYIEFKILKITQRYTSFLKYNHIFKFENNRDTPIISVSNASLLTELLSNILNEKSHITKKIRRVLAFLPLEAAYKYDESILFHISTDDFQKILLEDERIISPQVIDDSLPPPFFDWQIILNKSDQSNNAITGQDTPAPVEISYNQLSSGEIQFLQTISIHTYHLLNLLSIPNEPSRPKYKNFNLVFDEVEICFHPEMQRQFINKLITVLNDLHLPNDNYVNIFIITHSPFILSDIPASNILYLKDGQTCEQDGHKTFGANISDLCKDSFFLENGFVGDLAKERTNSLAKFLASKRKKDPIWNRENAQKFIKNIIGEPIIQNCLETLFKTKYGEDL
ncbi:MAG: AAA family ATPase [Fibrobacter sp.]|nr:AAA family ATPase [Fibrobacter sp.]MBR2898041.1 AAA family ATPase [Fibrobacter sp.]